MPTEIHVLALAALLQYLLMGVPANVQLGVAYTGGNRDEERRPTGVPGRLKRAMDNHFEGLVLFTIAVVVVVLADERSAVTGASAWIYLAARILYVPAYASGIFGVRSLIWSVGWIATAVMLVAALV